MAMKRLKISRGGQVSVPADVRKRWKTSTVVAEDLGDRLVLRPVADDPITAARGSLRSNVRRTSEEIRRRARTDERRSETRRRA